MTPDERRAYMREYMRKYRASPEYREKERERDRQYANENQDKRTAYMRERRTANNEHVNALRRISRQKNKETVNAVKRRYYAANKEKKAAEDRAYRLANPEKCSAMWHNKRARRKAAPGQHTAAEWLAKLAEHGGACFYCGSKTRITRDHRLALNRGGTNDIANIVPACLSCNCRKQDMSPEEFLDRLTGEGKCVQP
jgi:hypothetical protein